MMPTYQYECSACSHSFDVLQSITDSRLKKCPECGKNKLQRLIGAGVGIVFKGSGFYATDYKKKEPSKNESSSKGNKEAASCQGSPKACGCVHTH